MGGKLSRWGGARKTVKPASIPIPFLCSNAIIWYIRDIFLPCGLKENAFYNIFFLQEIPCETKMVMVFQPKIKTMTRTKGAAVQSCMMELGGIAAVCNQI